MKSNPYESKRDIGENYASPEIKETELQLKEIREGIIRPFWEKIIPVVREDAQIRSRCLNLNEKGVDYALSYITKPWADKILELKEVLPDLAVRVNREVEGAGSNVSSRDLFLIDNFNFESILRILSKRFSEEGLSVSEEYVLNKLNYYMDNNVVAQHNPMDQSMNISPFLNFDLSEYRVAFAHEFTHYFLTNANLDLREQLIAVFTTGDSEDGSLEIHREFWFFLAGLNEALAHIAESYFQRRLQRPDFEAYGSIGKSFSHIFNLLAVEGFRSIMNLEEFDQFSMDIYRSAFESWYKDLTSVDVDLIKRGVDDKIEEYKRIYQAKLS